MSAHPAITTPTRGHILVLDGLRGVAILLVMLYHAAKPFVHSPDLAPLITIDRFYINFCLCGWAGVDLFFVLSGFLITGVLLDSKPSEASVGSAGRGAYFKNFYMRRTLRIFPLHYLMLFLFFVVVPLIPHAGGGVVSREIGEYAALAPHQWWFWTYLSNFYFAKYGFAGHGIPDVLWSLAIEEQFYLVWPVLVLVLSRVALVRACIVVILGALAVRVGMLLNHVDPVAIFVLTPGRLDALAVGGLIAAVVRGPNGVQSLLRPALFCGGIGAAALAYIFLRRGHINEFFVETQTFGLTSIAMVSGATIVLAVSFPESLFGRVLRWRPLRVMGKYAYAIYLFHLTIQSVLRVALFSAEKVPRVMGSALPGLLAFNAVCIAASLGAAWVSWNVFEKHFLKLKARFPRVGSDGASTA